MYDGSTVYFLLGLVVGTFTTCVAIEGLHFLLEFILDRGETGAMIELTKHEAKQLKKDYENVL